MPTTLDTQYNPFVGDLTKYGQGPEHQWFNNLFGSSGDPAGGFTNVANNGLTDGSGSNGDAGNDDQNGGNGDGFSGGSGDGTGSDGLPDGGDAWAGGGPTVEDSIFGTDPIAGFLKAAGIMSPIGIGTGLGIASSGVQTAKDLEAAKSYLSNNWGITPAPGQFDLWSPQFWSGMLPGGNTMIDEVASAMAKAAGVPTSVMSDYLSHGARDPNYDWSKAGRGDLAAFTAQTQYGNRAEPPHTAPAPGSLNSPPVTQSPLGALGGLPSVGDEFYSPKSLGPGPAIEPGYVSAAPPSVEQSDIPGSPGLYSAQGTRGAPATPQVEAHSISADGMNDAVSDWSSDPDQNWGDEDDGPGDDGPDDDGNEDDGETDDSEW